MKKALAIAMLAGIAASFPAHAAMDEEAMMKQLQAMQEQMNRMQKEMAALKQELSQAKQQAATAQKAASEAKAVKLSGKAPAASGDDVKVSLTPAPKFETADGKYSFQINGRIQADAAMFNDDVRDHPDGTTLRRARLSVSGKLTENFKYKLENDFANNASALTDVYLQYTGLKPVSVTIGQFKEPFSMETLTSSRFTTFVERAAPVAFSPDRKIGIGVGTHGDSGAGAWTLNAGLFGDGTGVASTDDEAKDATARLTLAPVAEKTKVLHLGVAGSYRVPDSATDAMRFRSRPEVALTSSQAVDTGSITGVDDVRLLGLEAAAVYGPASIQGEYVRADVNRNAMADATFDGYYVEASYFLTGESKNYDAKKGVFDRVKPMWSLDPAQGNWGAWQLAARYSNLDLNDVGAGITGGEMKNMTFGLRWLPHPNVAVLANYIRVNTDGNAVTADDDPQAWVLRTQVDF